jgi:hypothetical protein
MELSTLKTQIKRFEIFLSRSGEEVRFEQFVW